MKLNFLRRGLCVLMVMVLSLSLLPTLMVRAAKENFAISSVTVTDIRIPVSGEKPDYNATTDSGYYSIENKNDAGYTNGISWEEYDADWEWSRTMTSSDTFRKGYIYVVFVKLQTASGKFFAENTTATINGNSALTNALVSSKTIYFAFEPCQQGIHAVALTVVSPVAGMTPTFAKINADSYESKNIDPKPVNQANGCIWANTTSGVNLSVSNAFKGNTDYTVAYSLFPKSGYTFGSNVTATINGKTAEVIQRDGYIIVSLSGLYPSKNVISPVTITGVTEPQVSKTPSYTFYASGANFKVEGETNDYWSNGIAWVEFVPGSLSGRLMKKTETFKGGYRYAIYIDVVSANDDYGFVKDSTVVTINGKTATINADDNTARLVYTFPALAQQTIPSVSVNCVAPTAGKTPNYNITTAGSHYSVVSQNDDYWTDGVAWLEFVPGSVSGKMMKKTDTFKAGNKYAIVMDVSVTTDGYIFVKDSTAATINSKAATLNVEADGKTARLMYTFAALSQMTLSKLELNVTAPAAGAKPSYDYLDSTGYYSDNLSNPTAAFSNGIAWYKNASSYFAVGGNQVFEAGKDYILKISLAPKAGYKFSGSMTVTVNGKTASVTLGADGNALVEVVLTTPAEAHTHTPSGWMTDHEYHWKVCTESACGSIVSPKQMHLNTDADGKCDTCGYQLPIEAPEDPTDPPVEDPTDPPVEDPTDPPADDPTDPPVEDPTDPPADDPTDPPADDPTDPTAKDPTETTPEKPTDEAEGSAGAGWLWIVIGGVAAAAVVLVLVLKKK